MKLIKINARYGRGNTEMASVICGPIEDDKLQETIMRLEQIDAEHGWAAQEEGEYDPVEIDEFEVDSVEDVIEGFIKADGAAAPELKSYETTEI